VVKYFLKVEKEVENHGCHEKDLSHLADFRTVNHVLVDVYHVVYSAEEKYDAVKRTAMSAESPHTRDDKH